MLKMGLLPLSLLVTLQLSVLLQASANSIRDAEPLIFSPSSLQSKLKHPDLSNYIAAMTKSPRRKLDDSSSSASPKKYVHMTPDLLSGILTGLLLVVTTLIGLSCLGSIQTPSQFTDKVPGLYLHNCFVAWGFTLSPLTFGCHIGLCPYFFLCCCVKASAFFKGVLIRCPPLRQEMCSPY